VAVTGIGIVSPLGADARATFDGWAAGRSAITAPRFALPPGLDVPCVGQVRDFDAAAVLGRKLARRTARYVHLALVAAREACAQAGLAQAPVDPDAIATVIGVGFGGLEVLEAELGVLAREGPLRVSPFVVPALTPNMAAGLVAMEMRARGPSFAVSSACASGGHAIGEAAAMIKHGAATIAIAGGAEACLTAAGLTAFFRLGALSRAPEGITLASRPFDLARDGFVMAEGAGILVLERMDHARARGARVLGELCGYGASNDATHATLPDASGDGAALAMKRALADAGLPPKAIGYVNAHGTSTPANDVAETLALKAVFGPDAERLWISSVKGSMGHALGAGGGIEAALTTMALAQGLFPPTTGLATHDPECDLDYIPRTARRGGFDFALSNSFAFGGQNASLVLGRGDPDPFTGS
jgi:3-oxoacyl-[acyl-carrier-protein] synthase II